MSDRIKIIITVFYIQRHFEVLPNAVLPKYKQGIAHLKKHKIMAMPKYDIITITVLLTRKLNLLFHSVSYIKYDVKTINAL